jgi:hypothetical protein
MKMATTHKTLKLVLNVSLFLSLSPCEVGAFYVLSVRKELYVLSVR